MDEIGSICNKCGSPKNINRECQICLAREEVAVTATTTDSFNDTMFFQ